MWKNERGGGSKKGRKGWGGRKKEREKEKVVRVIEDTVIGYKLMFNEIHKGEVGKNAAHAVFEEIISEKFSGPMKDINAQI